MNFQLTFSLDFSVNLRTNNSHFSASVSTQGKEAVGTILMDMVVVVLERTVIPAHHAH